jgi:predicted Ser/Thr protein kinase
MDEDPQSGVDSTASQPVTQAMPVGRPTPPKQPPNDPAAVAAAISEAGRYRVEEVLGEGGMGRVFRAHDLQLDRTVAIKILAIDDSRAHERFAREAQLQARVEHPNVAKVHETGVIADTPYIVMQYIPGRPLGSLSGEMSIEQQVRIVQRVAEGIHEAHRLGLVHGDIKPANVLVVRQAANSWHPYVLDFGIAREIAGTGTAPAGAVTGTPAYMAPEQVRGEPLDRRTDVYALGVTLYRLLSGKLPFTDRSSILLLPEVVHEEAPPLRKVAPQVSPDLEAIVMKCLDASPARRYPTARSLADDLVRYLDGEPVLARRQTFTYRTGTRIRKNRLLVGVSAVALLGIAVASGWALRERLQSARRTEVAERFGRQEERFEWTLRASNELPLHDTTPERDAVRAAIERLAREVADLPGTLRPPGDAAIGRGYLALGDEGAARGRLERAWKAGYRSPEVAYSLGLTLVHGYEEALARGRAARDAEQRRLALDDANRQLREPASLYLRASRGGDLVASEYLEALLFYLAGDFPATLQKVKAALTRFPWLSEALALEGQTWRALADRATDEAQRTAALGHAEEALGRAVQLSASDARHRLGLCEIEIERLRNVVFGSGNGTQELGAKAIDACDAALRADPQLMPALVRKTDALTLLAGFDLEHAGDPETRLRQAEAAAQAALHQRGDQAALHRALADIWNVRARALRMHGGDVASALTPAIGNLNWALRLDPTDWQSLAALGTAFGQKGVQDWEHSGNAAASFAASADSLHKAIALEPRLYTLYYQLGRTYGDWGEFLAGAGKDPSAVQRQALAAYRQALKIKPDYAQAYNSMGAVLFFQASQPPPGVDPMPLLAAAVGVFQEAIALQPDFANPRFNLGLIYREMGAKRVERGIDPWPDLNRAIASFREGIRLNPKIFFAYLEMGRIYQVGAEWELSQHHSPEAAVAVAVRLHNQTLAMQPGDFMALKERGTARMRLAEWEVQQHRSSDASLALAMADFQAAAKANTNDFGVYELIAFAQLVAAEGKQSRQLDPSAEIGAGLAAVAQGKKLSTIEEGGLLQVEGALELVRAETSTDPATRKTAAERSLAAYGAFLRLRPLVKTELEPKLARARLIASGAPTPPPAR